MGLVEIIHKVQILRDGGAIELQWWEGETKTNLLHFLTVAPQAP